MVIPSTALQDAVALLTAAMDVENPDQLDGLISEFGQRVDSDDLLLAVVGLCRSLCLVTSKLIHVIDESLTDAQANALGDDDLLAVAMQVVRRYATSAAADAGRHGDDEPPVT